MSEKNTSPLDIKELRILFLKGLTDSRTLEVFGLTPTGQIQYKLAGNLALERFVPIDDNKKEFAYLYQNIKDIDFTLPHLIVNNICDPDHMQISLKSAALIKDGIKQKTNCDVEVINPPEHIAHTQRETIYQLCKDIEGLIVPPTIRITPKSVQDVVELAQAGGITYPFIIRPTGTHGAKELIKIEDNSQHALLEQFAYNGTEYYLTTFHDYQSADNYYRKCRFIVIGGVPYPRHCIIGNDWIIHGSSRSAMKDNTALKQEEEQFMDNPLDRLNSEAKAAFQTIHSILGLDYFGIDCHITEEGNLLIFEINVAMTAMLQLDLESFPYLEPHIKRIQTALGDMIIEKAQQSAAQGHIG